MVSIRVAVFTIALLYSLTDCALAQDTIQVEELVPPGGVPYTPTPVSGTTNHYDIPAGSDLTVSCGETEVNVRYPTNKYAENERFALGNRVLETTETSGDRWTFTALEYYDTGAIECYSTASSTNTSLQSSIYIFVYDQTAPLYVPLKKPTTVYVGRNDYVPCLPTHSDITFTVTNPGSPPSVLRDNTLGFRLRTPPPLVPQLQQYTCTFNYPDVSRSDQQSVRVERESSKMYLPTPVISPAGNRYKYLAGEDLVMDCTVYGYTRIRLVQWSYPARVCDTHPSTNCMGTADRVTEGDPKFILPDRVDVYSTLTLRDLHPSDSGSYRCRYQPQVHNYSSDADSIDIRVFPAPFAKIIIRESERTYEKLNGEKVVILVNIEALPSPTVQWMFKGKELQHGGRYRIMTIPQHTASDYQALLEIDSVILADAGNYTLTVSVDGSTPDSQTVQLVVKVPPKIMVSHTYDGNKASFMSSEGKKYIQLDRMLKLECMVLEGVPNPSLLWQWQPCDLNNHCMVQEGAWLDLPTNLACSLTSNPYDNSPCFPNFGPKKQELKLNGEKSGWYRCVSDNGVGSPANFSVLTVVSALVPERAGVGFTTDTETAAERLVEGDDITLDCHVSRFNCDPGDVLITGSGGVRFTKDSEDVDWVNSPMDDNSYILKVTLRNVMLNMTANKYVCGCKSTTKRDVTLKVKSYVPPSWNKRVESNVNISVGDATTFECEPAGRPLPRVTWYKDGVALVRDNTTAEFSKDNYSLTIPYARKDDSGSYSCAGVTRPGKTIFSNFTLTVNESVTGPPLKKGEIAMIAIMILVVMVIAVVVTICIVRRYCRQKYTPHTLLLPSKEMINPDIPLDEQTDALPYDIGWEFPIGNLKLGMLLGQGAFGRVLKAEAMQIEEGVASTTVAVKAVRDHSDIEQVKALISELKILIHIGQHLNIVNLLGACTKDISKGHILVIVEFCRYGNLRSHLLKHRSTFNPSMELPEGENTAGVKLGQVTVDMTGDDDYLNPGTTEDKPVSTRDIMSWCYQIARGMEYLASIDYIHRDLAARNVLLADDNIVKICDFGLAKDIYKYQEYQKQTDGPLPIKWMALESLTHKVFNVRTDVWAYGVTIWELFSLAATPYPGWEIDDTFIDKLQDGYRMEIPKHCPEQVYEEVMLNCWHPDPEKRPNFAELAEMMGESVDQALKERLQNLEDPYLRNRDSRTDITIKQSSVRRRDRRDLESDYLPSKSLEPKANGSKAKAAQHNYYNTSPTASQPNKAAKLRKKEKGNEEEKMPLRVSVGSDDDDIDMPSVPAPSPSPWERQSHLAVQAHKADDSHSFNSVDSDSVRPPSYNYVMKKSDPAPPSGASSGDALGTKPSTSSSPATKGRSTPSSSRDALNQPPSNKSYIETTC